jgi:hypothetical protein
MQSVVSLGIKALEVMFATGIIGSAVVILLTTFEDLEVLYKKEETPSAPEQ